MPRFDECCVLIPAATLEDFPADLSDYDARSMLAGWTVLWHPRLLAATGQLPAWYRADSPPEPKDRQLIVVPSASDSLLPVDFQSRADAKDGCQLLRGESRPELIGQIAALDGAADQAHWARPAVISDGPRVVEVDDFFAAAYVALQIQVMTRRLRYTSNLDEIHLQNRAVDAAKAFLQGNAATAAAALHDVFDCLAQERDHYFASSDPHLIDLTLVTPSTINAMFNAMATDRASRGGQGPSSPLADSADVLPVPRNYLIDFDVATALESVDDVRTADLKQAIAEGAIGWAGGGPSSDVCFDALTLPQASEALAAAADRVAAVIGTKPQVFARFSGGVPGELLGQLATAGCVGVIPLDFLAGTGHGDEAKVILETDDARLEGLTAKPMDAASDSSFLTLGSKLGEAIDSGEIATALLVHWPGSTCDSFADLRRAATWGLALGRFWKIDDYFTAGEQPYHHGTVLATSKSSADLLNRLVDGGEASPLASFAERFCQVVLAEQSAILEGLTDLVTGGVRAPGGTPIERFAQAVVGRPGSGENGGVETIFLANPISIGRRTTVQSAAPIDPQAKHIYAVSASDSQQEITLDLPACGFVRLESCTETSATQAATKRSAGGGWFRRRSGRGRAIASRDRSEELIHLQNEFMEVVIHPHSGGIAGVYGGAVRGNRFSMQLIRQRDEVAGDSLATVMVGQSATILRSSPAAGVVQVSGQIRVEDEPIGEFKMEYTLRRGSRLLEVHGRVATSQPLGGDPWRNYVAARAAVAGEAAIYRGLVRDKIHRRASRRVVAPLGVLIDESERQTLVAGCGRPFHRQVSDRYLDTLLLVGSELEHEFDLVYGFDVPSPVAEARSAIAAPLSATLRAGQPAPAIGWIVHVSPKTAYLSDLRVDHRADGRLAAIVRVVQTRAQPGKANVRFSRDVASAVILDVPWRDALNVEIAGEQDRNRLKVAGDLVSIPLSGHGVVDLLVVFCGSQSG